MYMARYVVLQVDNTIFRSNQAESGGAVFLAIGLGQQAHFTNAFFGGNEASNGGAVYMYTGTGVDIFTECVFHDNYASKSLTHCRIGLLLILAYHTRQLPIGIFMVGSQTESVLCQLEQTCRPQSGGSAAAKVNIYVMYGEFNLYDQAK